MALDAARKRFSILGLGNPTIRLITPTGIVDAATRATFIDLYDGLQTKLGATVFCATYGMIDGSDVVVLGTIAEANATLGTILDANATYGMIDGSDVVTDGEINEDNASEGEIGC